MRRILSLVLIFMMAVPVGVVAEDVAPEDADSNALDERLDDMSAEASRFLRRLPEAERAWGSRVLALQESESRVAVEAARLRVRLELLPVNTTIVALLRDGQSVEGDLRETMQEEFALEVSPTADDPRFQRGERIIKRFRYESIDKAELPVWNGWMAPERVQEIPIGKRVEILVSNGEKFRGRLSGVAADGITLSLGSESVRDFSLEEVASVKRQGMPLELKLAIVAGIVVLALFGAYYGALAANGG